MKRAGKLAALVLWLALSASFALFVAATVYLGRGMAPPNQTADAITAGVLLLVALGWGFGTRTIIRWAQAASR